MKSFVNAQNILVTGGAGYIGSHTLPKLKERGHQAVILDDCRTGFKSAVPKEMIFINGNVGDSELVTRVLQEHSIQAVIHFAASTRVDESIDRPLEYYENNVVNTLSLLQACQNVGLQNLVFSSTAAVYADVKGRLIDEESKIDPATPYGRSKLICEKVIADWAMASGSNFILFRYFNAAGAARDGKNGSRIPQANHLIKVCAEAAVGRRPEVSIFGVDYETPDGTCVRDYIHVDDLADAHVLAVEHLAKGGRSATLNLGYGIGASVLEVIECMKKVSGSDFTVRKESRRQGDLVSVVADAQQAHNVLGWNPTSRALEEICRTAWQWEQKFGTAIL